jgi:hypothetical protein
MLAKRIGPALAAAGMVALAAVLTTPAHAFTIAGTTPNTTVGVTAADIGASFNIAWGIDINGPPASADLTAVSTWTVVSFSSTQLVLEIDIANTTVLGGANGLTQAAIHSFGIGVTPNAVGSLVTAGAVFDMISPGQGAPQNFPGGFSGIDVCMFGSNTCAGGAIGSGLQAGDDDTLTIALAGEFGENPEATLAFFPIKWQTNLGSFETGGVPGRVPPPGIPPIPVPAAFPLLATGLIALGAFARRKRAGTA